MKSYKITRKKFLRIKFKELEKLLKRYLPRKDYKLQFEDIFNQIKELIC